MDIEEENESFVEESHFIYKKIIQNIKSLIYKNYHHKWQINNYANKFYQELFIAII